MLKVIFKEVITSRKCNSKKSPQIVYSELLYKTEKTAWTTGVLKGAGEGGYGVNYKAYRLDNFRLSVGAGFELDAAEKSGKTVFHFAFGIKTLDNR